MARSTAWRPAGTHPEKTQLRLRGMIGVYHHWSPQHLHRYCAEFDFRFNRRKMTDGERTLEAFRKVEGKRLMYKSPVGKKNAEKA